MALGAITVVESAVADGPVRMDLLSFAADGAYPTGGSAGFQAAVRAALNKGNLEIVGVIPQDCGGYSVTYDKAADKLKVYTNDNDNVADGPGVQVANAANLGGVTFKVLVLTK
jgi:hypothetical protein